MDPDALLEMTRRQFFGRVGCGVGSFALANLLAAQGRGSNPLAPRAPHFAPKAKNVIFLFMAGAPSQIDLFDSKPMLVKHNKEFVPDELIQGERFAFIKGKPKLLGSPYKFAPHGQSGQVISELLPHLHTIADDIAIVRSMQTDQFNHAPAQLFTNTGYRLPGRPSMGSWLTYGLGSVNQDLPGFVVLISGPYGPDGGKSLWGSGFLPTHYQGVQFRSKGDPVLFVTNPPGIDPVTRRESLDVLGDLNRMRLDAVGDPEIATRIAQYELAYRMQTSVPELMDVSKESPETHAMYGTEPGAATFANNCLLARRLVERGVRFVQLYHWGWDSHGTSAGDDIMTSLPQRCKQTDQSAVALVTDLKRCGLLDETLVIWGGEFGRTPMNEERDGSTFLGRDHHPRAYSIWMAGGGIKPGVTLGATDELGYNVVEDPVHVHDLNATILHLMGIEHTRLTYRNQGRDFRLTDVHGNVVSKLLA